MNFAEFVRTRGAEVGILSQMGEEMAADLKEAEEEEASSVQDFEALTAAKNKEIAAATSAIEDKTERVGKVSGMRALGQN